MTGLIPIRQAVVCALAILFGCATSARAALTNGDFEAGSASWVVTSGTVLFSIDEGAAPGDGTAMMLENDNYLDGASLTSFGQIFILEPGDTALVFDYRLSVEGSGEIPETDLFRISLNGTRHDVASSSGLVFSGDFVEGSWSLDVSGLSRGNTTFAFLLWGEDDAFMTTVEIDNVTVTQNVLPVPAPGAAGLIALGLACMTSRGACRRRAS